jgi:hypothetical protein
MMTVSYSYEGVEAKAGREGGGEGVIVWKM